MKIHNVPALPNSNTALHQYLGKKAQPRRISVLNKPREHLLRNSDYMAAIVYFVSQYPTKPMCQTENPFNFRDKKTNKKYAIHKFHSTTD